MLGVAFRDRHVAAIIVAAALLAYSCECAGNRESGELILLPTADWKYRHGSYRRCGYDVKEQTSAACVVDRVSADRTPE